MKETRIRSIIKGLTWRMIASGTTMSIVFMMTGNIELVAGVGIADVTLKILFYYFHERAWGSIVWGKLGPEPQIINR